MTFTTSYADYDSARRAPAMLTGESSTMANWQEILREIMLKVTYTGSGGIIALDSDYDPFSFHIGSSPCVVAFWAIERTSKARVPEDPLGFPNVLKLSVVEQLQELQAALSLNKSQLAQVLRVSRPALYEWFRGKEPNPANIDRLHALLRCLVRAQASGANPLNAQFVRQLTNLDGPSLLELLVEKRFDEDRVVNAIEQAQVLGDAATRRSAAPRRAATQSRLRGSWT